MPNTDERSFARYVALGDSISIDDYPSLDLGTRLTGEPAEEVGAASLLYRNRDDLWPEFAGHDLSTRWPCIEYIDHTADGATTWNVLEAQLPNLPRDDGEPTLVTLTAGGNDLLQLFVSEPVDSTRGLQHVAVNLREILKRISTHFSDATIIVGTVYDPSDGTADLGPYQLTQHDAPTRRRMWNWVRSYNDVVKKLAAANGCLCADIHEHFLGHGITEPDPGKRWYWEEMIIEPNARGASEVRRLWLRALGLKPRAAGNSTE